MTVLGGDMLIFRRIDRSVEEKVVCDKPAQSNACGVQVASSMPESDAKGAKKTTV